MRLKPTSGVNYNNMEGRGWLKLDNDCDEKCRESFIFRNASGRRGGMDDAVEEGELEPGYEMSI